MTMSATLGRHLEQQNIPFELISHYHTGCSLRTASVAGIPAHQLAKAVVLMDEDQMLMAVVPADRRVHLSQLRRECGGNPGLATEESLAGRFPDCAPGAVPPVGAAFGLRTIVDDELDSEPEVYMEAGDHEMLIRMSHDGFVRLMRDAEHSHFAVPLR